MAPDANPGADRRPLPPKALEVVAPLAERGLDEGLCDACLGRLVARLGYGLTNAERGRSLRAGTPVSGASSTGATLDPPSLAPGPAEAADCALCEGLTAEGPERMADLALAAAEGIEHATFALGARVDEAVEAREEALWEDLGIDDGTAEPLRTELTREAGKRYEAASGATFEPRRPELTLVVDTRFWAVETEVAPLYLEGRYLKRARDLPQTRWHCRACRGSGCAECDMTGKLYADSVEELIGRRAMEAFAAQDAVLHGQGREDIDVRMLGTGRPFVLEVKRPRVRTPGGAGGQEGTGGEDGSDEAGGGDGEPATLEDLDALASAVEEGSDGRVAVVDLRWAGADDVARVKERRSRKTYRADVRLAADAADENLKKATSSLEGATIRQRTPSRVAHRRADRTRTRRVHRFEVASFDPERPREARVLVEGDAGLYIKELVTGDGGRTQPNLSDLLGIDAEVAALDVVAVGGDGKGAGTRDEDGDGEGPADGPDAGDDGGGHRG